MEDQAAHLRRYQGLTIHLGSMDAPQNQIIAAMIDLVQCVRPFAGADTVNICAHEATEMLKDAPEHMHQLVTAIVQMLVEAADQAGITPDTYRSEA